MKLFNCFIKMLVFFAFCPSLLLAESQGISLTGDTGIGMGRYLEDVKERNFALSGTFGFITNFSGKVIETKRASRDYDDRRHEYEKYLEEYTLEELGLDNMYPLFGISLEKKWKYLTFLFDLGYFSGESDGRAEREDFAIGVKEIEYQGQEYDYMLIPRGTSFDTDIQGGIISLTALLTPIHISFSEKLHLTPWIHLGIYSISGKLDIDAGEAQGITQYEYHPHDYVVAGKGEGWFGAGFPELGFGGELKYLIDEQKSISVEMYTVSVDWEGSTDQLGLNVRNDKDIDLDYNNFGLKVSVEFPLEKVDLIVGFEYQSMDSYVIAEAQDRSEEDIEAYKEKYDKEIDVDVKTMNGFISIRY